jgi:hypothetical protein
MKANTCLNCKHSKSMVGRKGSFFDSWDRFYVLCFKMDLNEITPTLRDFVSTCGCASWEPSDDMIDLTND